MEQYRNRPKHLCSLENDELIQVCTQWIQRLIDSGGREWSLNIPARPNSDPDLVLTELVERFKEMLEPVSAPSVPTLSENEYIDLSDLSEEDKKEMVTGFAQTVSKETMKLFYSLGLKTHIQCSVVNEPTDELFEFLFRKLPAPEAGQIAGVQWVKASERLPAPFKVVACKYTPKSPDPRRDTELHWGYVSKDGIWDMKWQHDQVEWLDESGSSLSTAKEPALLREALRKAMEMPPYLLSKANGFNWFHYLHIKGGSGSKNGSGGQHKFYVYYATPEEEEKIGTTSPEFACGELNIPCGYGDTIQEAYSLFLQSQTK